MSENIIDPQDDDQAPMIDADEDDWDDVRNGPNPRTRRRRLSRYERLQGLADQGIDTWEEYRGER